MIEPLIVSFLNVLMHHASHHLVRVSNASISCVCHWKICRKLDKMVKLVSGGIQGEAGQSIKIENQNEGLVNHFKTMFERLEPSLSSQCCIYRVSPYSQSE